MPPESSTRKAPPVSNNPSPKTRFSRGNPNFLSEKRKLEDPLFLFIASSDRKRLPNPGYHGGSRWCSSVRVLLGYDTKKKELTLRPHRSATQEKEGLLRLDWLGRDPRELGRPAARLLGPGRLGPLSRAGPRNQNGLRGCWIRPIR
jgi:hypothetical protein